MSRRAFRNRQPSGHGAYYGAGPRWSLPPSPFVPGCPRPGSMSRIPPSLLYLTIYNPTLKPALLEPDNEDAEEQAHILFYTAREHAVSRDRILRQVGLAKALVNFSE